MGLVRLRTCVLTVCTLVNLNLPHVAVAAAPPEPLPHGVWGPGALVWGPTATLLPAPPGTELYPPQGASPRTQVAHL